jgi:uncharacterized protein (DUF885 family)
VQSTCAVTLSPWLLMNLRYLAFTLAFIVSAYAASTPPPAASATFDTWVEAFTAEWTRTGGAPAETKAAGPAQKSPNTEGEDNYENPLEPFQVRRQRQLTLAQKGLDELKRWDSVQLSPTQIVSRSALRWSLEVRIAGEPFADHSFVFNQMPGGLHVSLVSALTERFLLRQPRDVDVYLERLGGVASRIDEGITRARAAAQRGLIPPRFILERTRQQLDMFLEPEAAGNVFVTNLSRRSETIKGLTPGARAAAVTKATQAVETNIKPAYARVRLFIDELMPKATNVAGISALPNGPAAYAYALHRYTSTRFTADEIHAIGLREVARIEAEMDQLLRTLGHTEGSVKTRYAVVADGQPLPPGPDPRGVMVARYTEYIRDAEKRSEKLFNVKPRAPVEVRREPALTERTASAHYTPPAVDGSRPGVFWAPLPGPKFSLNAQMRTLAYHEAVPGHHFQLTIQQEQKDLPRFRARRTFGGISAHSEGWGLYAERLAIEAGWYDGDPVSRLGALNGQLFRARRLVVDTGLHAKGWTREQAIEYGIVAREVERYVVNPGQACSYMIGMLRIIELREKAKAALGARFSLPAFHDVFLKTGTVPLDVLADVVDAWIAEQRKTT